MGRKLVLTGTTITNQNAPRLLHGDEMLTTGSLFLSDITHPDAPWATGSPTNGYAAPNLAATQAKNLTGAGDAAVAGLWKISGTPTVTRSSRGGIYTNGAFAGLMPPAPVIDYLMANPTHAFYISVWGARDTDSGTFSRVSQLTAGATATGTAYVFTTTAADPAATVSGTVGFPVPVGQFRTAAAYTGLTLAGATGAQLISANVAVAFGTWGNNGAGARRSYRYYLEDLTVSGRSWSQANAVDAQLYTREVTNPGGRYYGDAIA